MRLALSDRFARFAFGVLSLATFDDRLTPLKMQKPKRLLIQARNGRRRSCVLTLRVLPRSVTGNRFKSPIIMMERVKADENARSMRLNRCSWPATRQGDSGVQIVALPLMKSSSFGNRDVTARWSFSAATVLSPFTPECPDCLLLFANLDQGDLEAGMAF